MNEIADQTDTIKTVAKSNFTSKVNTVREEIITNY